jgi:hypothetical protein
MPESGALQPAEKPGGTVMLVSTGTDTSGAGRKWPWQLGMVALAQLVLTILMTVLLWLTNPDPTRMRGTMDDPFEVLFELLVFPVVTVVYPPLKYDSGANRFVLFFMLASLNSLVWAFVIVLALRPFRRG